MNLPVRLSLPRRSNGPIEEEEVVVVVEEEEEEEEGNLLVHQTTSIISGQILFSMSKTTQN